MNKTFIILLLLLFSAGITFSSKPSNSSGQQPQLGINLGNKAPEIIETSATGEILKLSDLEGKMVLIDFWAAWCGPCRRENPNLVKAYNTYKDQKFKEGKGFTVFSVSLDRTKDAWIKGINDDNLDWPYHVSDLQYFSSKHAVVYNVSSIPANFLINGDGIIVAKNLRGPQLDAVLAALSQ